MIKHNVTIGIAINIIIGIKSRPIPVQLLNVPAMETIIFEQITVISEPRGLIRTSLKVLNNIFNADGV